MIDIDRGWICHALLRPRLCHFFFFLTSGRNYRAVAAARRGNLSPREGTIEGVGGSARWKQEGCAVQRPLVARRIAFRRRRNAAFFPFHALYDRAMILATYCTYAVSIADY